MAALRLTTEGTTLAHGPSRTLPRTTAGPTGLGSGCREGVELDVGQSFWVGMLCAAGLSAEHPVTTSSTVPSARGVEAIQSLIQVRRCDVPKMTLDAAIDRPGSRINP